MPRKSRPDGLHKDTERCPFCFPLKLAPEAAARRGHHVVPSETYVKFALTQRRQNARRRREAPPTAARPVRGTQTGAERSPRERSDRRRRSGLPSGTFAHSLHPYVAHSLHPPSLFGLAEREGAAQRKQGATQRSEPERRGAPRAKRLFEGAARVPHERSELRGRSPSP